MDRKYRHAALACRLDKRNGFMMYKQHGGGLAAEKHEWSIDMSTDMQH
jgi:hypothetical protein